MTYFVSYAFTKGAGAGFGHADVTMKAPITDGTAVKNMGEEIRKKSDLDTVTVLSFTLYDSDETVKQLITDR